MCVCKCLVLALCCVSLVRSQVRSEAQSGTPDSGGVKVTVSNVRNQTAHHWISQVCLHHTDDGKSASAPWSVDVEPSTSSCGGAKPALDVKLTFTIPDPPCATEVNVDDLPKVSLSMTPSSVPTTLFTPATVTSTTVTPANATSAGISSTVKLSGPEIVRLLAVGTRVVRGDDWIWGDQDGKPPGVGRVTGNDTDKAGWIRVQWANNSTHRYRMGDEDKYDLKLAGPNTQADKL